MVNDWYILLINQWAGLMYASPCSIVHLTTYLLCVPGPVYCGGVLTLLQLWFLKAVHI